MRPIQGGNWIQQNELESAQTYISYCVEHSHISENKRNVSTRNRFGLEGTICTVKYPVWCKLPVEEDLFSSLDILSKNVIRMIRISMANKLADIGKLRLFSARLSLVMFKTY